MQGWLGVQYLSPHSPIRVNFMKRLSHEGNIAAKVESDKRILKVVDGDERGAFLRDALKSLCGVELIVMQESGGKKRKRGMDIRVIHREDGPMGRRSNNSHTNRLLLGNLKLLDPRGCLSESSRATRRLSYSFQTRWRISSKINERCSHQSTERDN